MAKWIELRIPSEHGADALKALLERFKPDCAQWDPMPPQATSVHEDGRPNEVAIRLEGVRENAAVQFLERRGISVCASKTMLHKPGLEGAEELGADSEARAGLAGGWSKRRGPGDAS